MEKWDANGIAGVTHLGGGGALCCRVVIIAFGE